MVGTVTAPAPQSGPDPTERGLTPSHFDLVDESPVRSLDSDASQAMVAEIGITMKIRVTEFATSLKQAEQGNYQAYLLAWSGRTDPDGNTYIFFKCNAPQDSMGYCKPEVDKLLDEARIPSDMAARKAIYEKLTKTILEDLPKVYLYHRRILIAHSTKLNGYKQMPDGLVRVVGLSLK